MTEDNNTGPTFYEVVNNAVNVINDHFMGNTTLSESQIEAAILIISRALPPLKPISFDEAINEDDFDNEIE
jgi:hypothetical protein